MDRTRGEKRVASSGQDPSRKRTQLGQQPLDPLLLGPQAGSVDVAPHSAAAPHALPRAHDLPQPRAPLQRAQDLPALRPQSQRILDQRAPPPRPFDLPPPRVHDLPQQRAHEQPAQLASLQRARDIPPMSPYDLSSQRARDIPSPLQSRDLSPQHSNAVSPQQSNGLSPRQAHNLPPRGAFNPSPPQVHDLTSPQRASDISPPQQPRSLPPRREYDLSSPPASDLSPPQSAHGLSPPPQRPQGLPPLQRPQGLPHPQRPQGLPHPQRPHGLPPQQVPHLPPPRVNDLPPDRARQTSGLLNESDNVPSFEELAERVDVPRNEYVYTHLDADCIRLVRIFMGDGADAINVSLEHVPIANSGPYEAISYCWGEDPAKREIRVDDKRFYVRNNLFEALRSIRRRDRAVYFWIDALCINQDDVDEKTRQVLMMNEIYQKAYRVCAWLGKGDEHSDFAMDFIPIVLTRRFTNTQLMSPASTHGLVSLTLLMGRDWFSRRWALMEVAFARELIVLCGSREVHWRDFVDAVRLLKSNLDDTSLLKSYPGQYSKLLRHSDPTAAIAFQDLSDKIFFRSVSSAGNVLQRYIGVENLVCDPAPLQCTDLRDILFSYYGLIQVPLVVDNELPEKAHYPLEIDYRLSPLEAYATFVGHCIRASGSPDIMCRPWAPLKRMRSYETSVHPSLLNHVPSWICSIEELPFGDPSARSTIRLNADSFIGRTDRKLYNASNGYLVNPLYPMLEVGPSMRGSVSLGGVLLGKITELSSEMADGIVHKECFDMIGGIDRDEDGVLQGVSDTLWRLLCGNRDPDNKPASHIYQLALLHLLEGMTTYRINTTELLGADQPAHVREYLNRVQAVVWNRKILISKTGAGDERLVGLAPRRAQVGDSVCIFFGGTVPFVVRLHEGPNGRCWEMIGDSYVDEKMDGEAMIGSDRTSLGMIQSEYEIL